LKGAWVFCPAPFLKQKIMHVKFKKRAQSICEIHKQDAVYVDQAGKVFLKQPKDRKTEKYEKKKTTKVKK